MGCGGSKEDVATGAGRGGKLFRRKSTMSASHPSSHASSPSSSDDTPVAVKDVVKELAAGEPKADVVEEASDEKPVAVVEDKEGEVVAVVKKDVTGDEVSATVDEAAQPPMKQEDELPKSTVADEAPVVEGAKVDEAKEAVALKVKEETAKPEETKEEEASPTSTNERGESIGQSTIEPMEANPLDEHKAEDDAPPVLESSEEENIAPAAVPASESTAN